MLFEDLLSFNLWMLASDHFTVTKFFFSKQDGLAAVAKILGEELKSGSESLHWKVDGTNTLGVLLGYLEAYRGWLKGRQNADRSLLKRSKEDYPFYSSDPLWVFPFEHTQLWADVAATVLAEYVELIDGICIQASQAELANIRNGLDHKRDDGKFPDADKMLACVSRLEQLVDIADSRCLVPKLLWSIREERDLYGNVVRAFADYRNTTYRLSGPSPIRFGPHVGRLDDDHKWFGTPFIKAPCDFIEVPNSYLLFSTSPMSVYREYWRDYPRRRFIPSHTVELPAPTE
jgi:hypothetical protein